MRFQKCCQHAYQASIKLVAHLASWTEKCLEDVYKKAVEDGHFGYGGQFCWFEPTDQQPEDEEMLEGNIGKGENAVEENPAFDLLQQMQAERASLEPAHGDGPEEPADELCEEKQDLANCPDQDQICSLLQVKGSADLPFSSEMQTGQKDGPNMLPSTVAEVFTLQGSLINRLFRLAVKLRASRGGADVGFIKNPQNARRASKDLNWFQCQGIVLVCFVAYHFFHNVS